MRITRETAAYNERRYSKPWIAKVVLEAGKLEFKWGQWIGDAPGSTGLLVLDLEVGEYFARGQKDNRQSKNSSPDYYQLGSNGKGITVTRQDIFLALSTPKTQEQPKIEEVANV
jgi:hypothetical protein